MNRYADPQRCPDCLGHIERGAPSCPHCELWLSGPLPVQLFQTLSDADELLARMRSAPHLNQHAPHLNRHAPHLNEQGGGGGRLSAASVPTILLGLGAVCLLVAAVVFLVVSWSVLGVGGRTATLVGLTGVVGGVAVVVARRGLRAAAESLGVVALGLLAFDLAGARDSGWLGDLGHPGFLLLLGSILALLGGTVAWAARRTPVGVLVGVEVIAVLAAASAVAGLVSGDWTSRSASLTFAVLAAAAATFAARRLALRCLTAGLGLVTGIVWVALAGHALDRALGSPTMRELWLGLEAWPMVIAAVLVLAVSTLSALPLPVRTLAVLGGELMLAAAALVPFTQGSLTGLTLAVLVLLVVGSALAEVTSGHWAAGSALALTPAALWTAGVGAAQLASAIERLVEAGLLGVWRGSLVGRLPEAALAHPRPWLLPLLAVALLVVGVVLARVFWVADRLLSPAAGLPLVAIWLVGSVAAALASYPVPVWLVLGVLLLAAVVLTTAALRTGQVTALLAGSVLLAGGVSLSLYDDGLTALAAGTALVLATATLWSWRHPWIGRVAGAVAAAVLTGSVWTWGALAGVPPTRGALAATLLLGALGIGVPLVLAATGRGSPGLLRRFPGFEVGALLSGSVVACAAVASTARTAAPTWTAVYLTAAGVLVTALALVRVDRRGVGWLGGSLLVAATWVRLWETGVEIPEAYTLPSATALLVIGTLHLRRRPDSSTMSALAAGLALATVPTLFWVLEHAAGLRALLLGLGALVLVILGARLRWTAPLVFGSAVGALVVLRHLVPAADAVPQWTLIASAGLMLVSMGITWERRVQEARAALGYVRSLR